jgi:ComF family protein
MSSIQVKSNPFHRALELCGDFISLFFPNYCLGCNNALVKGEEILCTDCILELPKTNYHLDPNNPIRQRLEGRIHLSHAIAFLRFRKTGIVQHLLHQLKYNNHPEVAVRLGKLYGQELTTVGFNKFFDLIVPVPLHKSRKRKRGYNQSAKFAQGLSESLNIPWNEECIGRMVKTDTQTRKNKIERWNNVKDVFRITRPELVCEKRILLVDDVITTGATLEACGHHLLEHGCKELSFACLAEAQ